MQKRILIAALSTWAALFAQTYNTENKSNVGLYNCAAAGASGTTYTCSFASAPAAYVTGQTYWFKADVANTGAATINFNGLGAKSIVKLANAVTTALAAGDLLAGQWTELVYDGTNMQMQGQLGSYPTTVMNLYTNAASTGTLTNGLVKLTGTATAVRTATTDLNGAIGICIAGCGTSGSATVQLQGTASCVFSNTSVSGDWVQISSATAGNCQDAGASYPGGGNEVIGVVSDGGGAGTHSVTLLLNTPTIFTVTNTSPVTSAANNLTEQNLMAVTIPAGYLNQAGKTLHVWTQAAYTTGSGTSNGTDTWKAKLCSVSGCATGTVITLPSSGGIVSGAVAISVTSGKSEFEIWSTTVSTGATGTMEAHGKLGIVLVAGATTPPTWYFDSNTAVTTTFDLTAAWFLQITVQKSVNGTSTASNTTTERLLFAEVR